MKRYDAQAGRFSNRALLAFTQAGLPQTLSSRPRADGKPAEILLYDEIGFWGVTAKDFAGQLAQVGPGPINLRINSPGGDVFDGLAIYSSLKQHDGAVNVIIDGLAASAASYIALAGDTVSIAPNAFMMIHNAWGLVIGNKADMTATAGVMSKIDGQMAALYSGKTGQSVDAISAQMDAETWFTAQEALDAGLADVIVDDDRSGGSASSAKATQSPPEDLLAQAGEIALASRRRMARLAEAENAL